MFWCSLSIMEIHPAFPCWPSTTLHHQALPSHLQNVLCRQGPTKTCPCPHVPPADRTQQGLGNCCQAVENNERLVDLKSGGFAFKDPSTALAVCRWIRNSQCLVLMWKWDISEHLNSLGFLQRGYGRGLDDIYISLKNWNVSPVFKNTQCI